MRPDPMAHLREVVGDGWRDLLESICDDVWNHSRDRYHLSIHRMDAINCIASGEIDHNGETYGFQLEIGESPGLIAFGVGVGEYEPPAREVLAFVPRRNISTQALAWRIRDAWAADPKSEANHFLDVLNGGLSYDAFFAPSIASRSADWKRRQDALDYFARTAADVVLASEVEARRREQIGVFEAP